MSGDQRWRFSQQVQEPGLLLSVFDLSLSAMGFDGRACNDIRHTHTHTHTHTLARVLVCVCVCVSAAGACFHTPGGMFVLLERHQSTYSFYLFICRCLEERQTDRRA